MQKMKICKKWKYAKNENMQKMKICKKWKYAKNENMQYIVEMHMKICTT